MESITCNTIHAFDLGSLYISNSVSLVFLSLLKFLLDQFCLFPLSMLSNVLTKSSWYLVSFLISVIALIVFPLSFQMLFIFASHLFSWSTLLEVCQFYLSFQRTKLAIWRPCRMLHYISLGSLFLVIVFFLLLCVSSVFFTLLKVERLSISAFLIFYCLDTVLILHLLCCSLINDSRFISCASLICGPLHFSVVVSYLIFCTVPNS